MKLRSVGRRAAGSLSQWFQAEAEGGDGCSPVFKNVRWKKIIIWVWNAVCRCHFLLHCKKKKKIAPFVVDLGQNRYGKRNILLNIHILAIATFFFFLLDQTSRVKYL